VGQSGLCGTALRVRSVPRSHGQDAERANSERQREIKGARERERKKGRKAQKSKK
jgi:hypothetical protein